MWNGTLSGLVATVDWISGTQVRTVLVLCMRNGHVLPSVLQKTGRVSWTYSADYLTVTGVTAVSGDIPAFLASGFASGAVAPSNITAHVCSAAALVHLLGAARVICDCYRFTIPRSTASGSIRPKPCPCLRASVMTSADVKYTALRAKAHCTAATASTWKMVRGCLLARGCSSAVSRLRTAHVSIPCGLGICLPLVVVVTAVGRLLCLSSNLHTPFARCCACLYTPCVIRCYSSPCRVSGTWCILRPVHVWWHTDCDGLVSYWWHSVPIHGLSSRPH